MSELRVDSRFTESESWVVRSWGERDREQRQRPPLTLNIHSFSSRETPGETWRGKGGSARLSQMVGEGKKWPESRACPRGKVMSIILGTAAGLAGDQRADTKNCLDILINNL